MRFFQVVYEIVRAVPPGKVISYGQVARMAGNPRMARQVGWALHASKPSDHIPWHRVVTKEGKVLDAVTEAGENLQRSLLLSEGVAFDDAGFVLPKYFIGNK